MSLPHVFKLFKAMGLQHIVAVNKFNEVKYKLLFYLKHVLLLIKNIV